jgi:hypothetical protein
VPGLLRGALVGQPAALRRLLGARRAGRLGIALAAAALVAAAPWHALPWLVGLDLALSVIAALLGSAGTRLDPRQHQRLVLWLVAPFAVAALPLRIARPASALPAALAVLAAHVWLYVLLRRGLDERRS